MNDEGTSPRDINIEYGTPRASPSWNGPEWTPASPRMPQQARRSTKVPESPRMPDKSPREKGLNYQRSNSEKSQSSRREAQAQQSQRPPQAAPAAPQRRQSAPAADPTSSRSRQSLSEFMRLAREVLPAPPDSLPESAATSALLVHEALLESMRRPEAERKTLLRDLQRQWHPDKNPENYKEVSTAVFQYINDISAVFLKGLEHLPPQPAPREPTENK